MNLHQFTELSENPQESLRIEIEFSKPVTRAFPVMLLVRCVDGDSYNENEIGVRHIVLRNVL